MKILIVIGLIAMIIFSVGCTDRNTDNVDAKPDSSAPEHSHSNYTGADHIKD